VNHWLFKVDVFAGFHGIDGGLLVPVVGGGDEDGIDVGTTEDLAIVASREEIDIIGSACAPELFGVREAAVVTVGDGDELDAGNLERGMGVALSLNAGADECELNGIISRFRCRGLLRFGEDVEAGGCCCEAADFKEGSAVQAHANASRFSEVKTDLAFEGKGRGFA